MQPLVIFDLDGTLADLTHRLHYIQRDKPDWDAFHRECYLDTPKAPMVKLAQRLYAGGAEIWVFSGRSDIVRGATERWLSMNNVPVGALVMRRHGDRTKDCHLKKKWLEDMWDADRERLICAVDDRQQVVDMWRDNGVVCLQCAPGDF